MSRGEGGGGNIPGPESSADTLSPTAGPSQARVGDLERRS